MSNITMKDITIPSLNNTYTFAQVDNTLAVSGAAADAKKTGDEISDIKNDLNNQISENTRNLCDPKKFKKGSISVSEEGVITGTAGEFNTQFFNGVPLDISFESGTQYTLSGYAKPDSSGTGNGLIIGFKYTDNTSSAVSMDNSWTEYTRFFVVSTSGKTISSVFASYVTGSSKVWNIKELQIEKGKTETPFIHSISAKDYINRENEKRNSEEIVKINGIGSVNLYTESGMVNDIYINASGSVNVYSGSALTDYIPVESNTSYIFTFTADTTVPVSSATLRIHEFTNEKQWIDQAASYQVNHGEQTAVPVTISFITNSSAKFVRISFGLKNSMVNSLLYSLTNGGITAYDYVARRNINEIITGIDKTTGTKILKFELGYYSVPAVGETINISNRANSFSTYSAKSECSEGEVVYIKAQGGSTARAFAFVDGNGKVISRAGENVSVDTILTAPEGTAYVIANCSRDYVESALLVVRESSEETKSIYCGIPDLINMYLTDGEYDYSNTQYLMSTVITESIIHVKKGAVVYSKNTVYEFNVVHYDENGNYVSKSSAVTSYTASNDEYIRLMFRKSAQNITVKDIEENVAFGSFKSYTTPRKETELSFLNMSWEGGYKDYYTTKNVGDCTLLKFPQNINMIVDFHQEQYKDHVLSALQIRGVRRVDYICISHYHSDHMGSLSYLVNNNYIDIEGATAFLPPEITTESLANIAGDDPQTLVDRQTAIVSLLTSKNCTIIRPTNDMTTKIGDSVLKWFNCDHSVYSEQGGDYFSRNYNDWSIAFQLVFGNEILTMTGDMGPISQRKVAGTLLKTTLLKSMHHGYDGGANDLIPKFISNLFPEIVISINSAEHAPTSSLESNINNAESPMQTWCEANGVPHYCTFNNGNINMLFGKNGLRFTVPTVAYIRNEKNWSWSDNSQHIET